MGMEKTLTRKLLIINQAQFGYHTDTLAYCRGLRNEWEISYFCWDYGLPKIQTDGVRVVYVSRRGAKLVRLARFIYEARQIMSACDNDIVFVPYFAGCVLLSPWSRSSNIILDIRSRSVRSQPLDRRYHDAVMVFESFFFDRLTTVSKGVTNGLGIGSRVIAVLPIGGYQHSKAVKSFDNMHLVYVGTLENRNIERTVQGFEIFCNTIKDATVATYDIIGFGDDVSVGRLKAVIAKSSRSQAIRYHGRMAHDEVQDVFSRCNIGIAFIPITSYFNEQPTTKLFEYLLAGLPVLATATKANMEIVDHQNGITCSDTVEGFADGLRRLADKRMKYSSEVIQAGSLQYSWENIISLHIAPFFRSIGSEKAMH